jgi:hypothetical protein
MVMQHKTHLYHVDGTCVLHETLESRIENRTTESLGMWEALFEPFHSMLIQIARDNPKILYVDPRGIEDHSSLVAMPRPNEED